MAKAAAAHKTLSNTFNLGFVPLVDAAPLIVALELGYFAEEGLNVVLHRQIGWGNVRDKLTFGQLDASHALLGMAPLSVLGKDQFVEPLVAVAGLGTGGNAITLSKRLSSMGITSAAALERLVHRRDVGQLTFAHVFSCSSHHYVLREWLAAGGINPDRDVRLCVLPPPQMVRQLAKGLLDGFCVGEPWNVLAQRQGLGTIALATTEIFPDHPEKALIVSRRWLSERGEVCQRLVRAVLRGCQYCEDPQNLSALCHQLSDSRYLNTPMEPLVQSMGLKVSGSIYRFRSWAPKTWAPNAAHAVWLLRQMDRWGHLPAGTDIQAVAQSSIDTAPYLAAVESVQTNSSNDQVFEGVK